MTSFITATATSETYTLSLHDALPIFEPELTAEAGLLVAAERDPRERRVRHVDPDRARLDPPREDRKSTRLNSSHTVTSYAVFCLKKKRTATPPRTICATHPAHSPSTL